ncbi:hypothetical protein PIB30_067208 [Stylosanthes scabra]|uniref:Uncharacterized protein n=1 Tax=Stylosanthes scabra TaxID=79078 RepID=A0ABU6VMB5_9FABA|nr:hypothetical protein [Stylosanthes scabra]
MTRAHEQGKGRAAPTPEDTPSPSKSTIPGTFQVAASQQQFVVVPNPDYPISLVPRPAGPSSHATATDHRHIVRNAARSPPPTEQVQKIPIYYGGHQRMFAEVLPRVQWLCSDLRKAWLTIFENDKAFKHRQEVNRANMASSNDDNLHIGGSSMIPNTRARMTRSLDRPLTGPELVKETHMRNIEWNDNFELASQRAREEGDESASSILRSSSFGGYSTSTTSTFAGSTQIALRERVQNPTQSLQSYGRSYNSNAMKFSLSRISLLNGMPV